MQKLVLTAASAVSLLALAVPASSSHVSGWYLGIEAGVNTNDDTSMLVDSIDPSFGGGFPPAGTMFDTGFMGAGTLGYAWPNLRLELELAYRDNDHDTFASAGVFTGTGDFNEFTQMVNVLWDIDLNPDIALSLGGGIGGDSISYKNSLHTVPFDGSDYVFAWQLIAGLSLSIGPTTDLVLNYRYMQADGPEFLETAGVILHNDTFDNVGHHSLTIGLRFDI
jgi:opacity protein-like surface antigen